MALQGNLRDFSATEILQLLGTQKKTGCLTLEDRGQRADVFVLEGRIVSTRSPGMPKDDPLLRFLIKARRLSDEQLRGLQTIHRESNRDLEDLLIKGRYLEPDELASYIERQILDDMMRVTRWEQGTYRFDPHSRWGQMPLVRMSAEAVLMETARRADEQKRFSARFPDHRVLLSVRDLPDPSEPLSEEERELFGIVDGRRTLAEVIAEAPLSEFETLDALHRMLEANWLEIIGRRDIVTPAPAPVEVEPARPRTTRISWARELVMAAVMLAAVAGLHFGARAFARSPATPPASDVFAAARLRDLRFALDLYRREQGRYPARLDDLVEGRWIAPEQASVPGWTLRYRPERGGDDYDLDLRPRD